MSFPSESLCRNGFPIDSSIFLDDDFLDWRWPASFPRRCDRECARGILGMEPSTHRNYDAARPSSCSCSSSSSSMEELFFYCTEELGSESTSGVGDLCVALSSSINEQRPSSSFAATPSITTNEHLYIYEKEYMSSSKQLVSSTPSCLFDSMKPISCVHATTTTTSTHDNCNWALQHQASASTTCINASIHNPDVEGPSTSSTKFPPLALPFHSANAPHHLHHCHVVSQGGNRTFPPPIASLLTDRPLMRSFKSNGRFILKKVSNVSRSLFRSTRENGHLRLDLLSCSFDCLESQYPLLFPASSSILSALEDVSAERMISTSDFGHVRDCKHESDMGSIPSPCHWLRSPSAYSILHQKPTLNYETVCPPSKLQAFAMLMCPKGARAPIVEEPISTSCTSFQAEHLIKGHTGGNTAVAQATPKVFAILKLLPGGLGLIVLDIGKSKGGDHVTMYGMYISKNFGPQSSWATLSPSHHFLTNLWGLGSEHSKGKLFPFEDCKGD